MEAAIESSILTRGGILSMLRRYEGIDSEDNASARQIASFLQSESAAFERSTQYGHMTASAWVVSTDRSRVLLLHHRKLDRWLQPGGHADGEEDLISVARRELHEECGVTDVELLSEEIFDVDVHVIPTRGSEPEHLHHDVRFLFVVDDKRPLVSNSESNALGWFDLATLESVTTEWSVLRMRDKALATSRHSQ